MVNAQELDSLNAEQLRALAAELIAQAAQRERVIAGKDGECRFTFNVSLLNFHLAPTPSMGHQISPQRHGSSARRVLANRKLPALTGLAFLSLSPEIASLRRWTNAHWESVVVQMMGSLKAFRRTAAGGVLRSAAQTA